MSNTYLVAYDSSQITPQNITRLTSAIKSYNGWAHPLTSVWLIKSDESADSIRTNLRNTINTTDRILIMNVTNDFWASANLSEEIVNWMQKI